MNPAMQLHILPQMFPSSMAVSAQAAAAHYNMRNFDEAQSLFEDILARDPFRIEVGVLRLLHKSSLVFP